MQSSNLASILPQISYVTTKLLVIVIPSCTSPNPKSYFQHSVECGHDFVAKFEHKFLKFTTLPHTSCLLLIHPDLAKSVSFLMGNKVARSKQGICIQFTGAGLEMTVCGGYKSAQVG